MKDLKSLKHFLIVRFIQIVVACALAEAIVFRMFGDALIRSLMLAFFHTDDISGMGLAELGMVAFAVLSGSILGFVKAVVPQQMVRPLLKMDTIPKPDDAADAIACAITHCQTGPAKSQFLMK